MVSTIWMLLLYPFTICFQLHPIASQYSGATFASQGDLALSPCMKTIGVWSAYPIQVIHRNPNNQFGVVNEIQQTRSILDLAMDWPIECPDRCQLYLSPEFHRVIDGAQRSSPTPREGRVYKGPNEARDEHSVRPMCKIPLVQCLEHEGSSWSSATRISCLSFPSLS